MYSISKEKNYMNDDGVEKCSQCISSFTYANNGFLSVDWKQEKIQQLSDWMKEIAWSTKK